MRITAKKTTKIQHNEHSSLRTVKNFFVNQTVAIIGEVTPRGKKVSLPVYPLRPPNQRQSAHHLSSVKCTMCQHSTPLYPSSRPHHNPPASACPPRFPSLPTSPLRQER